MEVVMLVAIADQLWEQRPGLRVRTGPGRELLPTSWALSAAARFKFFSGQG